MRRHRAIATIAILEPFKKLQRLDISFIEADQVDRLGIRIILDSALNELPLLKDLAITVSSIFWPSGHHGLSTSECDIETKKPCARLTHFRLWIMEARDYYTQEDIEDYSNSMNDFFGILKNFEDSLMSVKSMELDVSFDVQQCWSHPSRVLLSLPNLVDLKLKPGVGDLGFNIPIFISETTVTIKTITLECFACRSNFAQVKLLAALIFLSNPFPKRY